MSSPNFKFRLATPRDLRRNFIRFEPDRALYHHALWKKLPHLFEMLLEANRIRFALLEDASTGQAQMFAGHTFVDHKLFLEALHPDRYTVSDALFSMVDAGRVPFLAPKQIADGNECGSLIGFNFSATPEMSLGPAARTDEDMLLCPAAHRMTDFFLAGYHLREIWQESAVTRVSGFVNGLGLRTVRQTPCGHGHVRYLHRFTIDDARAAPGLAASNYIWTIEPKLGLSLGAQELVEYALLGHSDPEIVGLLKISEDGLKKRWRALYARVSAVDSSLVPESAAPRMKRKLILEALRGRLEEIRPYQRRVAKTTRGG